MTAVVCKETENAGARVYDRGATKKSLVVSLRRQTGGLKSVDCADKEVGFSVLREEYSNQG